MIKTKTAIVFDWDNIKGLNTGDMYWVSYPNDSSRDKCILTKLTETCLYFTQIILDKGELMTEKFYVTAEEIASGKVSIELYDYKLIDITSGEEDEDEE